MQKKLRRLLACAGLIAANLLLSPASQAEVWQLQLHGKRLVANQASKATQTLQEVPASETLSYDTAGAFIWSTHSRWPGGIEFRYRQTAKPTGSATIDVLKWRDGLDITAKDAEATRRDFADLAFYHPQLLRANLSELRELSNPDNAGGQRLWQFKDAAGRPASYLTSADGERLISAQSVNSSYTYLDYQSDAALASPQTLQIRRAEQLVAEWHLQFSARAAFSEAEFKLDAAYQDKPDRGPLRASKLAEGVYRIDGSASAYHTGFVVGSESIAVFDAPINPEQAKLAKALIEAQAPGLPIRHLVISHAHRDHINGSPAYWSDSLKIYTGRQGTPAIQRQLGKDFASRVSEVQHDSEIDLGQRKIQLFAINSAHAEEMLVAYDATSQTIFQGDLFYLPETGPVPPAFEVGFELKKLLQEKNLKVQHFVGVHGRSASYAEFLHALELAKP